MHMQKRKSDVPLGLALISLAIVAAIILGVLLFSGREKEDPKIAKGVKYLQSLEEKDPAVVEQIRRDRYQAELDAQREQLIQELSNGTRDPWSLFKDFVIMGDSRAMGFYSWGFLSKNRILAQGGYTIRNIDGYMDELIAMNPTAIYLCYGLNDVSSGKWDDPEVHAQEYMEAIGKIQEALPNATIVVSSILPVADVAYSHSKRWRDIPKWNEALKAACKNNGILYADCDPLNKYIDTLWDPVDGYHFRKEFYPHWASNLVATGLVKEAAQ